jgi:hypothetical protein
MKTSEIYIEQVFIGFLVIAICAAPWLRELAPLLKSFKTFSDFVLVGSAAIGVAFFIGIPFDRLSDTLTERLDRLHRLNVAFERAREPECTYDTDLYPEDRLQIECLRDSAGIVEQLDYYRARIRLSRALAIYGPAITLMTTFGIWRCFSSETCSPSTIGSWSASGCLHIGFGYCAIAAAFLIWIALIWTLGGLRRTNNSDFVSSARNKCWLVDEDVTVARKAPTVLGLWRSQWKTWIVPVTLLALSVSFTHSRSGILVPIAAGAGAALTFLSAWSWWRIMKTYRSFLLDVKRFEGKVPRS